MERSTAESRFNQRLCVQFDLKARHSSGLLKGFAYMHLKQGLEGHVINWKDRKELTDIGGS
jgi:hypothetical protein